MQAGWEKAPNWYEARIFIDKEQKLDEVFDWLVENVQGMRKHTVWRFAEDKMFVIRFRHVRDYEWFLLRWS